MNKSSILILITLLILITTCSCVWAAEIAWPPSPIPPFLTFDPDVDQLPTMVQYFYEWGIFIGAIATLISLTIGGFLYLTSTGNPAKMNEAKDRIFSALIGLVLLLAVYIILNAINPDLVVPTMPPFQPALFEAKMIIYELTNFDKTGDFLELDISDKINDLGAVFPTSAPAGMGNPVTIGSVEFIGNCALGQCAGYFYTMTNLRADPNVNNGDPAEICCGNSTSPPPNIADFAAVYGVDGFNGTVRSVEYKYPFLFGGQPCTNVTFYDQDNCTGGITSVGPTDCVGTTVTVRSVSVEGSCSVFLYGDSADCSSAETLLPLGGDIDPVCDYPDLDKFNPSGSPPEQFDSYKILDSSL